MVKLAYISIPLHLKAKIGPVGALGGISPAFRVFASEVLNGDPNPDAGSDYNVFDTTVYLGGSFKFLFLGVDIRYHWGLTSARKDGNYKNRFLQVGGNIYF